MNRFCGRLGLNPDFKVAQPLPDLLGKTEFENLKLNRSVFVEKPEKINSPVDYRFVLAATPEVSAISKRATF